MDIGKAFGYVFDDEKWISKVLIGGLLLIIPIFGQFVVFGYSLKVAENVARNNPRPLPEWTDFGDLFMRGLYYFVISIVYQIPTILLSCVLAAVLGSAGAAVDPDTGEGAGAIAGLAVCLYPLLFIVAIVLSVATYAAVARYVATGTLSEAFKFGEVIASVRTNLGTWVVFILVAILASFVGSLGAIACGVGALFTSMYAYSVIGHLLGQTIQRTGLVDAGSYPAPVSPYTPPPTYQ